MVVCDKLLCLYLDGPIFDKPPCFSELGNLDAGLPVLESGDRAAGFILLLESGDRASGFMLLLVCVREWRPGCRFHSADRE